jgi:hypothetical protein
MKKKRCRGCREYFPEDTCIRVPLGYFCSMSCASQHGTAKAKKARDKKAKQDHTKAKRKLKDEDKSFQDKKAQTIFNKFIRLRDAGEPCISCQKPPRKKNAGHYLSRGAHPELRFHPLNCHLQCEHCNSFKSGNQSLYRASLIKKIGVAEVEWIEGPHEAKRYTIANLKTIQRWFIRKTKRLERDVNNA